MSSLIFITMMFNILFTPCSLMREPKKKAKYINKIEQKIITIQYLKSLQQKDLDARKLSALD